MYEEQLRERVRILKAKGYVKSYIEVAELLEIKKNGFYNWLNGQYSLSYEKKQRLKQIIDTLTE